jgi:hypothetical protein
MAKINSWELKLTWEDGTENEVSSYLSEFLVRGIEEFIDQWEKKYGDDEEDKDE